MPYILPYMVKNIKYFYIYMYKTNPKEPTATQAKLTKHWKSQVQILQGQSHYQGPILYIGGMGAFIF